MFADDFLPSFIARLGVIVIHPDVVAAERAVIVRIGLPVGDIIKFPEPFPPAGSKDPRQQFVTSRIVILRLGERSEEHTSELQSLMRISYAVFCLKKKKKHTTKTEDKTTSD